MPHLIVRYAYEAWIHENHLYVKAEAHEYERATYESFRLQARRKMTAVAASLGVEDFAKGQGGVEVWDVARDYATDLPIAYTFRSRDPLPFDALVQREAVGSP